MSIAQVELSVSMVEKRTYCQAIASSCVSNDLGWAATSADIPGRASIAVPVDENGRKSAFVSAELCRGCGNPPSTTSMTATPVTVVTSCCIRLLASDTTAPP